jgi:hypothetical protein
MAINENDVLETLKKEWAQVERITAQKPEYCNYFVGQFQAMARFAEKLTGRRYAATEDGVIEY